MIRRSKYPLYYGVWIPLLTSLLLYPLGAAAKSDDSCGPWQMADVDSPAGTEYLSFIQIRSCDLPRGVSAFLQFQNTSNSKVQLTYKLTTSSQYPKEGDITLEPGDANRRAGTCQSCSTRKGGITKWEILAFEVVEEGEMPTVEETVPEKEPVSKQATTATSKPATDEKEPLATKQPSSTKKDVPTGSNLATSKSETESKQASPATKVSDPQAVKTQPAKQKEAVNTTKSEPVKKPEKQKQNPEKKLEPGPTPEGLVMDDGKLIPWDQVPREFWPKEMRK